MTFSTKSTNRFRSVNSVISEEWPPRQNLLALPPFGDATGQQCGHSSKGLE
jgi:hypothetical protein